MQIYPLIIPINFNQKIIYLTENEESVMPLLKGKSALIIFHFTSAEIQKLIAALEENTIQYLVLVGNIESSIHLMKQSFEFIRAGGGIVENPNHELLWIFRRGKWDLPKGKLDAGETIEACAIREVEEETGAENLVINQLVGKTYHVYRQGNLIFKQTDWFSMQTNSSTLLPQAEEGIEEAIWLKQEDLYKVLQNTFDSIKFVLKMGHWLKN